MPSWLDGTEEFGFAHTYHLYSFMGWGVGVALFKELADSTFEQFETESFGFYMVVLDFIAMGCSFVPLASCVCDC